MDRNDYKAFVEIVMGFAELKGKELSAPAIELYWRAMKRWPIEEFRAAAEHLLRTKEFMPVPKDFEDLRRSGEPTPGEAWQMILEGKADPNSNAYRAAEICGGRYHITHCDIERDLPHVQRRFFEVYKDLQDATESRSVPLPRSGKRELTHIGGITALKQLHQ